MRGSRPRCFSGAQPRRRPPPAPPHDAIPRWLPTGYSAQRSRNGFAAPRPGKTKSRVCGEKSPRFIPAFRTRATLDALPLTDGSANVPVQAGGRPPGVAGTCGTTTEEAVHRRVPLAAGSCLKGDDRPSQPPDRPLPLVRASAGRQPGRRWKRACGGPSCGCGSGVAFRRRGPGVPASPTQGPARAGRCHPSLARPVSGPAGRRHATACRMRTPSGEARVRARNAPPIQYISEVQPARGPPDPDLPANSGARARGAIRRLPHPPMAGTPPDGRREGRGWCGDY